MTKLSSNPLAIRIQTTSVGGLAQFAFNANLLNAHSVWMRLIQINVHLICIIFAVWTGLLIICLHRTGLNWLNSLIMQHSVIISIMTEMIKWPYAKEGFIQLCNYGLCVCKYEKKYYFLFICLYTSKGIYL